MSGAKNVPKKEKGPFTNDVSREGEGGGCPISDERKGGCVDLVLTRGGRGSKFRKFSRRHLCMLPERALCVRVICD